MRRFLPLILVFVLVFATAIPCFADSVDAVLLPVYDNPVDTYTSPYYISYGGDTNIRRFGANQSEVYLALLDDGNGSYYYVAMSPRPYAQLYRKNADDTVATLYLTRSTNGYYYSSSALSIIDFDYTNVPVNISSNISDFVNDFFVQHSVVFSITDLVNGSVSWLSTVANAVKSSGLLLFMVLIGFIGIGIGLFRRFVNHG